MREFIVEWYVSGYCGSFRYSVVANNINEAKKIWISFVEENEDVKYSWKKAERGVEKHYGGYIRWKEICESSKEIGCYKMDFDNWNVGSDHLMD